MGLASVFALCTSRSSRSDPTLTLKGWVARSRSATAAAWGAFCEGYDVAVRSPHRGRDRGRGDAAALHRWSRHTCHLPASRHCSQHRATDPRPPSAQGERPANSTLVTARPVRAANPTMGRRYTGAEGDDGPRAPTRTGFYRWHHHRTRSGEQASATRGEDVPDVGLRSSVGHAGRLGRLRLRATRLSSARQRVRCGARLLAVPLHRVHGEPGVRLVCAVHGPGTVVLRWNDDDEPL